MEKIAIVGSGIAGLGTAWLLRGQFEVTVFEADDRLGGHAHTVTVQEGERSVPIDTGFMVFNRVTYPHLTRLFETLGVPMKGTDMSFSVRNETRDLEYCGSSLNHLFAQRRNVLRPSFYRMLGRIGRFNRDAVEALGDPAVASLTLEDYVARRGYGDDFFRLYLLPMSSAVWSTPPEKMLRFPASTLLRFFHNHGFLGMHSQHPWWTVEGGSRVYVEKLIAPFRDRIRLRSAVRSIRRGVDGINVATDTDAQRFDRVVLACHSPAAAGMLGRDATPLERRVLSAFAFQPNRATLHTDRRVMPRTRLAWASWNYRLDAPAGGSPRASSNEKAPESPSTHYWMNRLQGVSRRADYFVSINGQDRLSPTNILRSIDYEHPLFDLGATRAQAEIPALNAAALETTRTHFVGAWQRYGFHEDGLHSAVELARLLLGRDPWSPP
jgi:predicted NAD/FAD-binding protein